MRNFLIKVNKFNQKQWLLFSIITTTVGVWFPFVLNFFGTHLFLTRIDANGKTVFTLLGFILTFATISWSLLSMISQRYCEYHNHNLGISEDNLNNTETMYSLLNSSSTLIIEKGLQEKLTYINNLLVDKENTEKLMPIKKPCDTLKNITSEMISVLSSLLSYKEYNVKRKDLHVNIYYNFSSNDDHESWHKAHSFEQDKGLTIIELLQTNTTFFEALHSPNHYAFYNDKSVAEKQKRYQRDSEDDSKPSGSIACFYYEITKDENVYIRFMITIATYGKNFSKRNSDKENENIALNFKRCVLPEYEMLIKSALADLYITHLLQ